MTDKIANVHWEGRGKKGVGRISTETDALKSYPYGFASAERARSIILLTSEFA